MNNNNAKKWIDWLETHHRQTEMLTSLAELAAWDQRTMIPKKGHPHRGAQLETVARIVLQRNVDPRVAEALGEIEAIGTAGFSDDQLLNLAWWKRSHERLKRVPESLAAELARASAEGESAWEQARPRNDWTGFAPHLERQVSLSKRLAEHLQEAGEPYDALLDEYEPGMTARDVATLFDDIRQPLMDLFQQVKQPPGKEAGSAPYGPFPVPAQRALSREVAAILGFDFEAGRLDETAHPFTCGIGPGDVRITTRYDERDLVGGLLGTIHEAGHAMYDQGLPAIHFGTPRGAYASLGIHESQSRLWENMVGRSRPFWQYLLPRAAARFDGLKGVEVEDFVNKINVVRPSLIRTEADEVSYNLHILIRFELERALFTGDLQVGDLPGAFADKMAQYLGIVPDSVANGAMQDVHWAAGMFGYFPTYTLGNLYAAQLFAAVKAQIHDLDAEMSNGVFSSLRDWLTKRIHQRGRVLPSARLIEEACGAPPDSRFFIEHCKARYL